MKSKKIYAMFQKKDVLRLWNKIYDDNGEKAWNCSKAATINSWNRRSGK